MRIFVDIFCVLICYYITFAELLLIFLIDVLLLLVSWLILCVRINYRMETNREKGRKINFVSKF